MQDDDDDDTALMASLSFRKADDEGFISALDCESPQQISAAPREPPDEIGDGNGDDSDGDFAFVLGDPETDTRISAEGVFSSGKILPVYPVFGRQLVHEGAAPGGGATDAEKETKVLVHSLQHLFIGEREANPIGSVSEDDEEVELSDIPEVPPGSYSSWAPRSSASSPAQCKKSNSTGSLLRWRIKDLVMGRSHSDGKEKFVFLAAEKRDPENKDGKKAAGAVAFKEKRNWSGNLHWRRSSHDEKTPSAAADAVAFKEKRNWSGNLHRIRSSHDEKTPTAAADAVAFKEKRNWSGNLHRIRSSHDEKTPTAAADAVAFKEKRNWSGNLHRSRSSHDEKTPAAAAEKDKKKQTKGRREGGKEAETDMAINHRIFYGNANRLGKGGPRRSFLPYKQELIGLFAGVNMLSRNYHPI